MRMIFWNEPIKAAANKKDQKQKRLLENTKLRNHSLIRTAEITE